VRPSIAGTGDVVEGSGPIGTWVAFTIGRLKDRIFSLFMNAAENSETYQKEMEMKDAPTRRRATRRKITFSLNAPDASVVYLVGEFNGWDCRKHPMRKKGNGMWEKQVSLPAGRFEYKFVVDDQWREDPLNERICFNCFGTRNSIVNVRI
jgi:hypothetical protein